MNLLLQHWLTHQANMRPDSAFIVTDERKWTYGQIEAKSNQLAWLLKDRGCRPGDRIGIHMSGSAEALITIFGILKSDCIYVPLDPDGPADRSNKMIRKAGVTWIIAGGSENRKVAHLLSGNGITSLLRVGWINFSDLQRNVNTCPVKPDFTLEDLRQFDDYPPVYKNRPDDPAHIQFSSGSIREPSGVVNTHCKDIQLVKWAVTHFGITSSDRLSGHPPLHFNMSGMDIFSTVATGAELHPVPAKINILPNNISEFIRERSLTQWVSVPSILTHIATMDAVKPDDFSSLKRLMWRGETMPANTLTYLMKRLPHVTFTNLYRPTETPLSSGYQMAAK